MSKLFYNSTGRKENKKELNEYVLIFQSPTCELDTEVKFIILMYCLYQVFFPVFFFSSKLVSASYAEAIRTFNNQVYQVYCSDFINCEIENGFYVLILLFQMTMNAQTNQDEGRSVGTELVCMLILHPVHR